MQIETLNKTTFKSTRARDKAAWNRIIRWNEMMTKEHLLKIKVWTETNKLVSNRIVKDCVIAKTKIEENKIENKQELHTLDKQQPSAPLMRDWKQSQFLAHTTCAYDKRCTGAVHSHIHFRW